MYNRRSCLGACLAELDFAEGLEAGERTRYQRMVRLLAYSFLLHKRGSMVPDRADPAVLFPSWRDGDERFVPRLLQSSWSLDLSTFAKAPISPNGWAWLKEQAEASQWPADVKVDLTQVVREHDSLYQRPSP